VTSLVVADADPGSLKRKAKEEEEEESVSKKPTYVQNNTLVVGLMERVRASSLHDFGGFFRQYQEGMKDALKSIENISEKYRASTEHLANALCKTSQDHTAAVRYTMEIVRELCLEKSKYVLHHCLLGC
jgi:hypothetical protein